MTATLFLTLLSPWVMPTSLLRVHWSEILASGLVAVLVERDKAAVPLFVDSPRNKNPRKPFAPLAAPTTALNTSSYDSPAVTVCSVLEVTTVTVSPAVLRIDNWYPACSIEVFDPDVDGS
jgi:hypothetical protein